MLNRTANILQLHTKAISRTTLVSRRLPLSTSAIRPAKKDEDPPKNPMEKRDTDTKPYAAEYTRSGRNEDVSQKDTAYDPTKTDPKEQKHAIRKEESGKLDSGSLDVSPAEESVSKDYDKSDEEAASSRHRGAPSTFVKTPNHEAASEGDMSKSNVGRDKYKRLRHDKSQEPTYHRP